MPDTVADRMAMFDPTVTAARLEVLKLAAEKAASAADVVSVADAMWNWLVMVAPNA